MNLLNNSGEIGCVRAVGNLWLPTARTHPNSQLLRSYTTIYLVKKPGEALLGEPHAPICHGD